MANLGQCCRRVFGAGASRSSPCSKPATVERDGKLYCGIHDPVSEAARRQKREEKWQAKWEAEDLARARKRADAEIVRMARRCRERQSLPDELVEAIRLREEMGDD